MPSRPQHDPKLRVSCIFVNSHLIPGTGTPSVLRVNRSTFDLHGGPSSLSYPPPRRTDRVPLGGGTHTWFTRRTLVVGNWEEVSRPEVPGVRRRRPGRPRSGGFRAPGGPWACPRRSTSRTRGWPFDRNRSHRRRHGEGTEWDGSARVSWETRVHPTVTGPTWK